MSVDKGMNVLVVDDYQTMIRIISNLLKQLGFNNIDSASDGTEALTKIKDRITSYNVCYTKLLRLLFFADPMYSRN